MKFDSFEQVIAYHGRRNAQRTAVLFAEHNEVREVRWEDFARAVEQKVQKFRIMDNNCAGFYADPSPAWILHLFAAAIAGKRVVLLDPALPPEAVEPLMADTGVDFLFCDRPERLQKLRPAVQRNLLAYKERGGKKQEVECAGELLFYTSGTTRQGKAVVLSQKALCSSCWNGQQLLPATRQDVVLSLLPLNHVFGFVCCMLWPLSQGAAVAIGRGARYYGEDLMLFRPSVLPVVPTLLKYLLQVGRINENLRAILVGAGPAQAEILEAAARKGIEVRFGYGLTETASGLAMSARGEDPFLLTPCPEVQLRVDEEGQLYVRTTCMMDGYYHLPGDTGRVLKDGELATGDLAEQEEDGRIRILGRVDDVIVFPNGQKVFCPDLEKTLARKIGTQVALTVREGQLTLVAVGDHRMLQEAQDAVDEENRHRTREQQIIRVEMRDEPFPRTANGKLRRFMI